MKYTSIAILVSSTMLGISPAFAETVSIQIEEIAVSGDLGDEKAESAFKQAGAVSIRGEEKQMQSLDSVVRALPGSYTNINPAQGTVSVNIRGMSGLGRVNTLVDGVPQTFFGTSANGDRRFHDEHGGLAPSSQHGTMIDPNFLTEVNINKGVTTGANGVNALAGSAVFKTLDIEDVIFKGNKVGIRSKFSYGSNDLGYSGMASVAGQTQAFSETGKIGALFAYSQRKIGSNYKRGDGKSAKTNDYAKQLDEKPKSWLAKIEISPNEYHRLLLSGREYESNIGGRKMLNKNHSLNYHYAPESDLVDLEVLLSHTQNEQRYNQDSALWQLTDASTKNKSQYVDIKNSNYFNIFDSELSTTLGATYFNNRYVRQATGQNQDNLDYTPFAPVGEQNVASLYLNSKWKKDIYALEGGLTYTYANFKGFKPACGSVNGYTIPCFPQGAYNIKMVNYAVDPSILLSAELSDWFSPFVSYNKSHRIPNIQEVFFNNESGGSMNPFLKPEKADTYQIGFNTFKHSWLIDTDKLGIKLLYYRSKIKNFITSESFYISKSGQFTQDINDVGSGDFHSQISINSLSPVKTSGIELELNYDSGDYFGRLSYSYEKTSQPIGVQSSADGFGFGDIYELPKHYATLDLGARLLDKKLTLGGIIKYSQKVKRISPKGINAGTNDAIEVQELPQNPMIVDIYANYEINKNFTLKASVQNLFNSMYIDPLNSQNSTRSQFVSDGRGGEAYTFTNYARGRTYLIGGEVRF